MSTTTATIDTALAQGALNRAEAAFQRVLEASRSARHAEAFMVASRAQHVIDARLAADEAACEVDAAAHEVHNLTDGRGPLGDQAEATAAAAVGLVQPVTAMHHRCVERRRCGTGGR